MAKRAESARRNVDEDDGLGRQEDGAAMERNRETGRRQQARDAGNGKAKSEDYDDMRELEDALQIDEHALEEALRDQPTLFYRVSKAYALEISRRDAAKQALADSEARADLAVREEARDEELRAAGAKAGDKAAAQSKIKFTEGEARARVQTSTEVVRAHARFAELSESVGKLTALKEAFQQRSYALKDLAGLYVANYYTASEHTAASGAVRSRNAGEARARMNDARRERA